jgi:hypothetical protein
MPLLCGPPALWTQRPRRPSYTKGYTGARATALTG